MATTADRIKEGLEKRGMRQSDLAKYAEISRSSLCEYIAGKNEPKQRNIYKIARALNVNEAWLLGYDVPMERKPLASAPTISPNRRALLELAETATDEQISMLLRLAKAVLEQEK